MYQPKKKPKGKELTPEEKAENKIISSIRILIAHISAGVKRCRIVKDVLRNTKLFFADQVMEIACGLHNFRTTLRYNTLERISKPTLLRIMSIVTATKRPRRTLHVQD